MVCGVAEGRVSPPGDPVGLGEFAGALSLVEEQGYVEESAEVVVVDGEGGCG